MAYSELIKNFDKIRDYMRDFYVYGFRTRADFDAKSLRSYDNEKRRVESWLSDFMSFRQDANGKQVFLSVDSRTIPHNPLYKAFKAKSFTDKDIILHFYIMDILASGDAFTVSEITKFINDDYLAFFDTDFMPDDSTVRNKLREYEKLGLLKAEKQGKVIRYSRVESDISDRKLIDAISFATEDNPVGVIGSFLLDKYETVPEYFAFKHRYLLEAFEEEILVDLLLAMRERDSVEVEFKSKGKSETRSFRLYPLKIYVSTQNGKQYLMAYSYKFERINMFRLDRIVKVKLLEYDPMSASFESLIPAYTKYLWGVVDRTREGVSFDHVELTLSYNEGEEFILKRVQREMRCGTVELVDKNTILYKADVYDAQELVPWMRTFIGRIVKFESSNKEIEEKFYSDICEMRAMYGDNMK